ncbi:MAG: transposase [Synergistaceae bacterium]|jgi:transposase|nr:transposase [Synergistaceae bacterium]
MSYIFEQSIGKYRYVYEGTSYRDEKGKVRTTRTAIGKIDSRTGQRVYKPEYIERMRSSGTPAAIAATEKQFTVEDIKHSEVTECGMTHLLKELAVRNGLIHAMKTTFPFVWQELFMLACFLVVTGDPFVYCEEWVKGADGFPVGSMSSQRISELLAAIDRQSREQFFKAWCACRGEQEYLALDITSASSYSELIDDVEWGYNRDGENLAQINICMLMGEESRLPVYETVFAGSIRDVSTLYTTMAEFKEIAGGKPLFAVMDKGFYSKKNVDALRSDSAKQKFIVPVPFTAKFAKKAVESERKDIDRITNTIIVGENSMRAVTKERAWYGTGDIHVHVYYNAKKASNSREALYAEVAILKEEAEFEPQKCSKSKEHRKYLNIRKSASAPSGYTIKIREDAVFDSLSTSGWVVLISNETADARKAMQIYRAKDVVEKGFLRLKRDLDLGRLRVHSDDRMLNKVFVGFISLILLAELDKTMSDKGLYRNNMTMQQLIRRLSKLRAVYVGGSRIVYPVTKEQRQIFDAFKISPPV